MDEIVAMSVEEGKIFVMMVVMVAILMMNLQYVHCTQA
jgi:hypothetical protein